MSARRGVPQPRPPQHHNLNWQQQALCAQTGFSLFFVEPGETSDDAKRVCSMCDVCLECLDYAVSQEVNPAGVWGGETEKERRRTRATRRRGAA
jgi:WhiB family redox-sensing transcriptional regulator